MRILRLRASPSAQDDMEIWKLGSFLFVGGGASTPRMDEQVVQWPTPTTSIVGARNDHLFEQKPKTHVILRREATKNLRGDNPSVTACAVPPPFTQGRLGDPSLALKMTCRWCAKRSFFYTTYPAREPSIEIEDTPQYVVGNPFSGAYFGGIFCAYC